jgi:predicted nucleotidyltransferase component of viral defense system
MPENMGDGVGGIEADLRAWVEAARSDPVLHRDRQVTEIVLSAIGLTPSLQATLVLKGGTLMALAFKSPRATGDVDFTAEADPEEFDRLLTSELDAALRKVAVRLGYLDLLCRVQTIRRMPRTQGFADHEFPALLVRVGSAKRNTGEEKRLLAGRAIQVLDMEISFRDQVHDVQNLRLDHAGAVIRAFTIHEIIAEKLRALLQQPVRNRYRRQDIYDIAFLLDGFEATHADRERIVRTLMAKCRSRRIIPRPDSLADPEVIRRARADWDSMKLELAGLPPFEERYAVVDRFYRSLPWP